MRLEIVTFGATTALMTLITLTGTASAEFIRARCYMVLDDGTQIAMPNGDDLNTHCFQLPSRCVKGRPYHLSNVHYMTPEIYIEPPLELCHAR
jgi:hypothetical protein